MATYNMKNMPITRVRVSLGKEYGISAPLILVTCSKKIATTFTCHCNPLPICNNFIYVSQHSTVQTAANKLSSIRTHNLAITMTGHARL